MAQQSLTNTKNNINTDNLNEILGLAVTLNASDIHLEPYDKKFRIRFRIDGILHEYYNLEAGIFTKIISKIKVLANMDISEKRLPQSGSFKIILSLTEINLRVSTCPTIYGEKVVLRLLKSTKDILDLESIGMQHWQQTLFYNAIQQPQGLILITGPTGSGKTSSLYAAVKLLNTQDKNIVTAEDPVEIHFPDINQVNINEALGITYNNILKIFLRQDPNVIIIGEIRDALTATIAIQAAQTGHLVLATLHANTAKQTLARLANLGISKHDAISTISLIINQRLVRKLCNCKLKDQWLNIFIPGQCQQCHHGYMGRIGVFEFITNLKTNKTLMKNRYSLQQDCIYKIKQGLTSVAEVKKLYNLCNTLKSPINIK